MKQVEKEYEGKAVVKVIGIDQSEENYNLAEKYNIRVVPTLIFLNVDGSEYKRVEGFTSQKDIEAIFSKMGVK
jgi:thioredoxin 1